MQEGGGAKGLTLTTPPSQVKTGLSSPSLVTMETRPECRLPSVMEAKSEFGARSLHVAWGEDTG